MRGILIIYFVGINLVTFLLYGVDKWKVVALDRRKLTFRVVVYDDNGIVGQGTHERFVIDEKKFAQKMEAKKQ